MALFFKQLELGPMQNYVYLVGDTVERKVAVIDPAWQPDVILDEVRRHDLTLSHIFVTHYHPDHLGGKMMGLEIEGAAALLAAGVEAKVHIHKAEAPFVKRVTDLSDHDLVHTESGQVVNVGQVPVTFMHTPGHTPGSQCFLVDGRLVSGDTLFIGSCGRVDLPGANPEQMYESLTQKLAKLPDETVLYPGHSYGGGASSTIGAEKRGNPTMKADSLKSFLRRMGYA